MKHSEPDSALAGRLMSPGVDTPSTSQVPMPAQRSGKARPFVALCPGIGARIRRLPPGLWSVVGQSQDTWQKADAAAVSCGLPALSTDLVESEGTGASVPEGFRGELLGFVTSVALHRSLYAQDVAPTALLGHSFGHHTALTCAGGFDVGDGVRLLVARENVLRDRAPTGTGMMCLETDAQTARLLLRQTDDPLLAVACYNSPRQTVICGPRDALAVVEKSAREQGIDALRIPVPYGFHGPVLASVVQPLRTALGPIRQRPLRIPVLSAVTGRFCRDDDDLLTEMAHAVAHPVLFEDAVRTLRSQGATLFVEYGLRPMLTRLIGHIDARADTACPVDPHRSAPAAFTDLLRRLGRFGTQEG